MMWPDEMETGKNRGLLVAWGLSGSRRGRQRGKVATRREEGKNPGTPGAGALRRRERPSPARLCSCVGPVVVASFVGESVPYGTMSLLEQAITLAVQVHAGQKDRHGEPYILHPLRVMLRMSTDTERIAAVLHDVVEDSPLGLDDLRARGFTAEVVEIVDRLTKREGEAYDALIARAASHPTARRVKLADLEDNMDVRRMHVVTAADAARLERYRAAWESLQDAHQR